MDKTSETDTFSITDVREKPKFNNQHSNQVIKEFEVFVGNPVYFLFIIMLLRACGTCSLHD